MNCSRGELSAKEALESWAKVGGFDGTLRLRIVEVINPLTDTWREVTSMSTIRCTFGIEVVDGQLFVIGGFNAHRTTSEVECYNPATDEWFDAKEMAVARRFLSCCVVTGLPNMAKYSAPRDAVQTQCADPSANVPDQIARSDFILLPSWATNHWMICYALYVVMGRLFDFAESDMAALRRWWWCLLANYPVKWPPMYERRSGLSVAVLDGLIYAIGGVVGDQWHKTVERYDPNTNQCTMMSPMNEPRGDASATSLQGRIYICGGFSGEEYLDSAETFNPETNQWTLITPMSSCRCNLGVIAYEDLVYAVGGFDGTRRLRIVEVINPLTDTWREVTSMSTIRCTFGIEVVDGQLFVIGGFNAHRSTSEVECYNPATDEWFDAKEMAAGFSAAV